jgi:hypothetical protein
MKHIGLCTQDGPEAPILEIARSKDFSLERLKDALKRAAEIH